MKFKKKPVIIEAIQWHGNLEDLKPFIDAGMEYTFTDAKKLWIRTLEGSMCVKENAWAIKGVQGEFYPCHPVIPNLFPGPTFLYFRLRIRNTNHISADTHALQSLFCKIKSDG